MGNLLNKQAAPARPKITAKDKAILDLKVQRDKLKQYQKKVHVVGKLQLYRGRGMTQGFNMSIDVGRWHSGKGNRDRTGTPQARQETAGSAVFEKETVPGVAAGKDRWAVDESGTIGRVLGGVIGSFYGSVLGYKEYDNIVLGLNVA